MGRYTIYALQVYTRRYNFYRSAYNLDGKEGQQTYLALQRYLQWRGYYPGILDGNWGPMTLNGMIDLAEAHNLVYMPTRSNVFDWRFISAMQYYLNYRR